MNKIGLFFFVLWLLGISALIIFHIKDNNKTLESSSNGDCLRISPPRGFGFYGEVIENTGEEVIVKVILEKNSFSYYSPVDTKSCKGTG